MCPLLSGAANVIYRNAERRQARRENRRSPRPDRRKRRPTKANRRWCKPRCAPISRRSRTFQALNAATCERQLRTALVYAIDAFCSQHFGTHTQRLSSAGFRHACYGPDSTFRSGSGCFYGAKALKCGRSKVGWLFPHGPPNPLRVS